MSGIFFLSVFLKGLGAILEIFLQIFLIRHIGMEGYGTYTTWINGADLIFWVCFSGLIKGNTFYLAEEGVSIGKYRKKYYLYYVFPVLLFLGSGLLVFKKEGSYFFVLLITLLELLVLDKSSMLIAKRKSMQSLFGEYVFGRSILTIGVIALWRLGQLTFEHLIVLYLFQYIAILLLFIVSAKSIPKAGKDVSEQVSIKKIRAYQRADIVQAMIGQMPVIVQFLFAGAYEAGVVSIVLLVKKLVNFITGPTAKVFLPEFSRLYKANNISELCEKFASIMRIQMLFVGPLVVVLAGYSEIVLRIWEESLLKYAHLFVICSVIFVVAATLGPCGGILQMSGNEKKDNFYREIALAAMCLTMVIFREDQLFVLYGLCVQTFIESIGKYICVCRFLGKSPVTIKEYTSWWLLPVSAIAISYLLKLQNSFAAMIICVMVIFSFNVFREVRAYWNQITKLFCRK